MSYNTVDICVVDSCVLVLWSLDMDLCTPKGKVNVNATQPTIKRVPPFLSKSTLKKPTARHLEKRLDSSICGVKKFKNTKQEKSR